MNTKLSRRTLLRGGLAALPLTFLWRRRARADGYGALVPDPDGLLDLPPGFSYRIIDRRGDLMTDGYRVPGAPDGMACFAGPAGSNTLVLMRNHELANGSGGWGPLVPGMPTPSPMYDEASQGGVTRIVLDATTLDTVSSNLALYGTIRNCGGGMSPWGWMSAEEDTSPNHGYVFLCTITDEGVQIPRRIDGYGRMMHEGAVVDPDTLIAYITEDRPDSCLYRFVPDSLETPFAGRLQALRVVGADGFDTGAAPGAGESWSIDWVDVPEPAPAADDCRAQGRDRGAARFVRGEGIWFHDHAVYFTATEGGPGGDGQVFRLDPDGDGGTLTLVAQSEDPDVLYHPDAITVSPTGDVYVCEDGDGDEYVRIVSADGTVSDFAHKLPVPGELAGACFSPDGSVLFLNLMLEGITVAITGPFPTVDPVEPGGPGTRPDPTADWPLTPGRHDASAVAGGCSAGSGAGLGTAALAAAVAAKLSRD